MSQRIMHSSQVPSCQVCGKQALFQCSSCQTVYYCSRQHQFDHWKSGHKIVCQISKFQPEDLQLKILQIRKSYYQNFSNQQFTECLLDAKVLVGLQKKRLQINQNSTSQLDYGGTVCLLTKTYLLLNDRKNAKQWLQNYLNQKSAMLFDMKEIVSLKQKYSAKQKYYEHLQKKLSLISCIGNLSYAIGINCIQFYVLYTKVIISFFGPDSSEASNCYFLIGCYYAEQGYFRKAIQCFKKSQKIRKNFGGDCLFNIGILYKLQGQLARALQILQKALKLRTQQYGQDSNKVAQINEIMGIIYTQSNDFKTAMMQYQKAYKLRSNQNKNSQESQNVLTLIYQLYKKLCLFIKTGQPKVKKTEIYIALKDQIEQQPLFWQTFGKQKMQDDDDLKQNIVEEVTTKKKQQQKQKPKGAFQINLQINQEFISQLGLNQLYRLSELQLQLQKCQSQFGVIYTIGTSPFYTNLTPELYSQLQVYNKKLFELIKMQHLNQIKNKQA